MARSASVAWAMAGEISSWASLAVTSVLRSPAAIFLRVLTVFTWRSSEKASMARASWPISSPRTIFSRVPR